MNPYGTKETSFEESSSTLKLNLALQLLQNAAINHPSLKEILVDRPETFYLKNWLQSSQSIREKPELEKVIESRTAHDEDSRQT